MGPEPPALPALPHFLGPGPGCRHPLGPMSLEPWRRHPFGCWPRSTHKLWTGPGPRLGPGARSALPLQPVPRAWDVLGDRPRQGYRVAQPSGQAITEEQDLRPLPSLSSASMATHAGSPPHLILPFREAAAQSWEGGGHRVPMPGGGALGGLRGEPLPFLAPQCPHLSNGGGDLEALGR